MKLNKNIFSLIIIIFIKNKTHNYYYQNYIKKISVLKQSALIIFINMNSYMILPFSNFNHCFS